MAAYDTIGDVMVSGLKVFDGITCLGDLGWMVMSKLLEAGWAPINVQVVREQSRVREVLLFISLADRARHHSLVDEINRQDQWAYRVLECQDWVDEASGYLVESRLIATCREAPSTRTPRSLRATPVKHYRYWPVDFPHPPSPVQPTVTFGAYRRESAISPGFMRDDGLADTWWNIRYWRREVPCLWEQRGEYDWVGERWPPVVTPVLPAPTISWSEMLARVRELVRDERLASMRARGIQYPLRGTARISVATRFERAASADSRPTTSRPSGRR
jgi:hypothetical protein